MFTVNGQSYENDTNNTKMCCFQSVCMLSITQDLINYPSKLRFLTLSHLCVTVSFVTAARLMNHGILLINNSTVCEA